MLKHSGSHFVTVAVPRPLDQNYSYLISEDLATKVKKGSWVKVPFGRSVTHGYVLDPAQPLSELPEDLDAKKLKSVLEAGAIGVPEDVLRLCEWASEYYRAPLGEILQAAAPAAALGLRNKKREARALGLPTEALSSRLVKLTQDQESVVSGLNALDSGTALLHGVTGSGKTEVYIEVAKQRLSNGEGVLFLVPEIALTPQLHHRIEKGLGHPVGLWHSAMSDGKRRDYWSALRKGELKVVVGARSAVFAPIQNLGLIAVDEEHDSTYKQEDRVRYHARDLAIVRANLAGALCILGSATPSLETRENARQKKFHFFSLPERVGDSQMPEVELVSLKDEPRISGIQAIFAEKTIKVLQETLDQGKQAMVFLNRRGFSAFLLCESCGAVPSCPDCSISLTLHKRLDELRCHICGFRQTRPIRCAACDSDALSPIGAGTESLEEELPRLVEGMRPQRLDRDQITSTQRLEKALAEFREGKTNVLLGTQMLVKGHDFPNVTLVIVVLADALFRWPDFRAAERAFQILTQVSGRAGRGSDPGRVLIQTFDPSHPVLRVLAEEMSESDFLEQERELRQVLDYPPFGRLARLRTEGKTRAEASTRAKRLADCLKNTSGVQVLGPSEAMIERVKRSYRWDFLIKSQSIRDLHRGVERAKSVARQKGWSVLVDIDPNSVG